MRFKDRKPATNRAKFVHNSKQKGCIETDQVVKVKLIFNESGILGTIHIKLKVRTFRIIFVLSKVKGRKGLQKVNNGFSKYTTVF